MILPLVSAYLLFAWITSYYSDQKVGEYYEVYGELQEINSILRDPDLYIPEASMDEIEEIVTNSLSITLYNQDGLKLYSSMTKAPLGGQPSMDKEMLFTNLYDLDQGLRAFT